MMINILLTFIAVVTAKSLTNGLRVSGEFDVNHDFFKFVAKFGFQKTDQLNVGQTQGFIFGNATRLTGVTGMLLLMPERSEGIPFFFLALDKGVVRFQFSSQKLP